MEHRSDLLSGATRRARDIATLAREQAAMLRVEYPKLRHAEAFAGVLDSIANNVDQLGDQVAVARIAADLDLDADTVHLLHEAVKLLEELHAGPEQCGCPMPWPGGGLVDNHCRRTAGHGGDHSMFGLAPEVDA